MGGGWGWVWSNAGGDGFIDREGWQTPHRKRTNRPAKGEGVLE